MDGPVKRMTMNQHEQTGSQTTVYQKPYCKHCGLILDSDLGWTSWDGTTCIDREISVAVGLPDKISSFLHFNSLRWDESRQIFCRAYSDVEYTLQEVALEIQKLGIEIPDLAICEEYM